MGNRHSHSFGHRHSRRPFNKLKLVVAVLSFWLIAVCCFMFYLLWNLKVEPVKNATDWKLPDYLKDQNLIDNLESRRPKEIMKSHLMRFRNKLLEKIRESTTQGVFDSDEILVNLTLRDINTNPYTYIVTPRWLVTDKDLQSVELMNATTVVRVTRNAVTLNGSKKKETSVNHTKHKNQTSKPNNINGTNTNEAFLNRTKHENHTSKPNNIHGTKTNEASINLSTKVKSKSNHTSKPNTTVKRKYYVQLL